MRRKLSMLIAALVVALSGSVLAGTLTSPSHALAAPGGQGQAQLAHFCQFAQATGEYPFPTLSTVGACVSFIASGFSSNAVAPGVCNYIAAAEGGYPIEFFYFNPDTGYETFAYAANQGACVAFFAQNPITLDYLEFVTFYYY